GSTYRLMVRVRGRGVADDAAGTLARIGIHGQDAAHDVELDAATLRQDQWHTVEVATLHPAHGQGLWIALTPDADNDDLLDAVQLDAFWLEPVDATPTPDPDS
ncbi:MAG: hypothetical protein WD009_12355, partial [Phycisphaeraceae bacterium]